MAVGTVRDVLCASAALASAHKSFGAGAEWRRGGAGRGGARRGAAPRPSLVALSRSD